MLFTLLLTTLLAQAPAPPTAAEALALAAAGRDADALAAFQARASLNPNDHEARLWIARLHERMGNPDLAEPVYRSVLLEDGSSIDAMVGLGTALLAQDETDEAIEILERAESLAPQYDAVLVALGEAHARAGHDAMAIAYMERAVAVAPTTEYRMALEQARRTYGHRVETRGFNEAFDGPTPDSNLGELLVNVRVRDSVRVFGRAQVQRKFRIRDERAGGGVEWRWTPQVAVRGQALFGPDNVVLPEGDYLGEIAFAGRRAAVAGAFRYFDFNGAWVAVLSPSLAWVATERVTLGAGYAVSTTESNTFTGRQRGHSGYVRGDYRVHPRVWITGGWAGGVEDFEHFSIDRIGDFRANTVSGGLRFELPTLTSVTAAYERQWQRGNVELGRVTLSLAQRF